LVLHSFPTRRSSDLCLRLWSESDHRHRPAHSDPEIRRLDLAEVILQLLDMGVEDVRGFEWLERPSEEAVGHALELLKELGAIVGDRKSTRLNSSHSQ